jgi:hypothetical protein
MSYILPPGGNGWARFLKMTARKSPPLMACYPLQNSMIAYLCAMLFFCSIIFIMCLIKINLYSITELLVIFDQFFVFDISIYIQSFVFMLDKNIFIR